jgi:hypothetical protein
MDKIKILLCRMQTALRVVNLNLKLFVMGKQPRGAFLRATIGNVTYYVADGVGYARKKSSLTAKRVRKDKKFEKTRQHARDLGLASRIASPIYKALPMDVKGRWLFRAITGEAASLLYEGKTEEEVSQLLWNKYILKTKCVTEEEIKTGRIEYKFATKESRTQLWKIFRDRWADQNKPGYIFKRIWERRGIFRNENIPRMLGIVPMV